MQARLFPDVFERDFFAGVEAVNRFMLRAMVPENALDLFDFRNGAHVAEDDRQSQDAFNDVSKPVGDALIEIGRASCRERV